MVQDQLNTKRSLDVSGRTYHYFSLKAAQEKIGSLETLPFSLKVLLENLLRYEDGETVTVDDIYALADWLKNATSSREIAYRPARVLMQDFTGVPAVVDLAAMREAIKSMGGNPERINPLTPVDLVIDHSVMVDQFASNAAFGGNVEKEYARNRERYAFLRWGQQSFDNFRVVPPGTGICHQVNLEYLSKVVWNTEKNGENLIYPDTLVGTDSHTTMVNGLSVLGWGVGGIEAEAAMLGQPISMKIPDVIGLKITGALAEGATATDAVLTITQILREKGVVGKFVEFYGDGLDHMTIADRATISNMAPEYGATCGFFPIDKETIRYLNFTGREERALLVEEYAKAQGIWRDQNTKEPKFTDVVSLDLGDVQPCVAGPKRPQDRILLREAKAAFNTSLNEEAGSALDSTALSNAIDTDNLSNGSVVIAAITSCTNTSNPSVMLAAGLIARKAKARGLKPRPWVKTSMAPGSKVVTDYLAAAGLQEDLDALGFHLVGYGCTTCIGNSGPLPQVVADQVDRENLTVAGVLSGNRNFEGRIHPQVKFNYLASPPLVVAYALAGNMNIDLYKDPIGKSEDGTFVYLKDIWPSNQEIQDILDQSLTPEMFKSRYADVFKGDEIWQSLGDSQSLTYEWDPQSTYVKHPPFFEDMQKEANPFASIKGARTLAILGNSVTTDHISPAGSIPIDGPTGQYLTEKGVEPVLFNSFGSRRGNHEVMMRGTFANIRMRNELVPGTHGGVTRHYPSREIMPIYEAAMRYRVENIPLVVIAGREYGTGSSRDWAAKGTRLLGVKAVIAESFERIHRSNLIGMGVLPLQFPKGVTRLTLGLDGSERIDIELPAGGLTPGMDVRMMISREDGQKEDIMLLCRLDTFDEVKYLNNGGILHYVLRNLMTQEVA